MLKKTTLLISILFVLFLCLNVVCAHENVTDEVLGVDQSEILSDAPTGNFSELASEISNAEETITLEKDYKYVSGDTVSSAGITINKTITIDGKGHTIDASNLVRIFSVSASNVVLKNLTLINGRNNGNGGAIYVNNAVNFTISDSILENNYAGDYGGAIYTTSSNTALNNCVFNNNRAYYGGGAVRSTGNDLLINNSSFNKNTMSYSGLNSNNVGGSVYSSGSRARIFNSNFTGSSSKSYAGAVMSKGTYFSLINSTFKDNYAADGGAVSAQGSYAFMDNCKFYNNSATVYDGGAVAWYGSRGTINNSYFENNSAVNHGAGVFYHTNYGTLNNLTAVNNYAAVGAGVYIISSDYENDNSYSYTTLSNSKFINNTALYGGAGVDATSHATVVNATFINNTANSYGGALGLTNAEVKYSKFINNSATFGGAIYTYNSKISDSYFEGNKASNGSAVYVLDSSTFENNVYDNEDIFLYDNGTRGSVISNSHNIANLMSTNEGYFAYCAERYNTNPYNGVYDNRMILLKNSINHQPVGEYLKILIYLYLDHMQDLRDHDFHDYVWAFTDYEYWNSQDPIVKEVIALYDTGFRVPTEHACKVLSNGTLMYFNFSSMITPSGQQNLFLFKFWYGDQINETLTKEALNKTAFVGDEVEFRIVVSNKGKSPLYDVFVEDNDYSNGLEYETWTAEIGSWSYNNKTKQWRLDELLPGKSASIILFFRVMVNGTLYNNATGGVGNRNVTNGTNGTRVYNPNFTVEKITLNRTVELGETVEFEIVIRNTGDIALTDFFVEEDSYDGLEYVDYHKGSLWNYEKVNGKHRWTFSGSLPIGEVTGFTVIFNTTAYGNFTNVVVAGSNETDNKTANNTTKVLKPDLSVEKHSLTPYVQLGNETTFQIIVKNTGEVDLDDIVVIEDSYVGLEFVRANTGNIWDEFESNGKKAWKLKLTLKPGEEEILFVTFKASRVGNYTNIVIASSNKTGNRTSNNTTTYNETVPDLPEDTANFTVTKVTLNETVLVGECVTFEIIVKNTGNKKLTNLTVYETKYDGLKYVDYTDHFKMWIFNKDKMSWTLNSTFYPGEEVGFFVIFNTTATGKYTNVVVTSSNETDNKTGNDTVKVLKPGINVEKITINKTVVKGEQVRFEIVVHNIGEEILDKVTVRELNYDGLLYDQFEDFSDYWRKNDDLSWSLMKKLAPGEYEGFFVIFNTTKRGTFTNVVVVESNDTDNDANNDSVWVLDYNLTVSKITLNTVAYIGQLVEFEIIVLNNGDLDLENVFVVEDKYDSGLVYVDYYSVNGVWKHFINSQGKHQFTLNDLLKVGKSASFRVIFNTTRTGVFTNSVSAGYNNTTLTNSTNQTEVIEKISPIDNQTVNKTVVDKNISQNTTNTDKIKNLKIADKNATGNPLLVLILVLAIIPFRRFKY